MEQALNLAESDHALSGFLLFPIPGLLERHARECAKHAALISEIVSLLSAEPSGDPEVAPPRLRQVPGETARLIEPLSQSEVRMPRYLPTSLSVTEIAERLYLRLTRSRTHLRHLFAKLGVHCRTEAVTRARALGLLAPSATLPKTYPQFGDAVTRGSSCRRARSHASVRKS